MYLKGWLVLQVQLGLYTLKCWLVLQVQLGLYTLKHTCQVTCFLQVRPKNFAYFALEPIFFSHPSGHEITRDFKLPPDITRIF